MTRDSVARKLISGRLLEGEPTPGAPIALAIDQTLTQDATGTLVMLTLEALGLDRVKTELSAQYIDHNLLAEDHRNPDDQLFLLSGAKRWGMWCAPAGTGVSHPLHMRYFGRPGASMLGSDSHTPAAGSLGMLAIGAGGLDVAMAMAGEPFRMKMPEIWGVRLSGELPERVSAKDVILEMLRRHGVEGGNGRIIEYHGPGLKALSAMDRHVIANMGTELGAVTTVFPADEEVRRFLESEGRGEAFREIAADADADYDVEEEIDLAGLEPLIAMPTSPGNVVPVREVAGEAVAQSYIGSSANPGYRDLAVVAEMVQGRATPPGVSLDVNPTTRDQVADLARTGLLFDLLGAGARLHQAGCNGCIGMGQAPATGRNSLRTVPRNFPGRSGTQEDRVFLCSPETAAASALAGAIADPREVPRRDVDLSPPQPPTRSLDTFQKPLPPEDARKVELDKGPNITALPDLEPLPDAIEAPVLMVAPDDVSTDEIMPAGADVLPYRSNIEKISEFVFRDLDPDYVEWAQEARREDGHVIVGGRNYGQGSSREHAALAPRHLGLRAVIAVTYARIHRRNLINYGVVPFLFADEGDRGRLKRDLRVHLDGLREGLREAETLTARLDGEEELRLRLDLSEEERAMLLAGGRINRWRETRAA
jgi:aconitate hydratase